MADISVVKQPKQERTELDRWMEFETPLLRGSLFGVNPFALMRQFTNDRDRFFGTSRAMATELDAWRPAVEVKEKDGTLHVSAELPGVKKEDIKVNVTNDSLTVEGERKSEKEEKREGYYHSERSYGKFSRTIPLPEGAKTDQAAAHFVNGVLTVSIPVPEVKQNTKQIPISEAPKTKTAAS